MLQCALFPLVGFVFFLILSPQCKPLAPALVRGNEPLDLTHVIQVVFPKLKESLEFYPILVAEEVSQNWSQLLVLESVLHHLSVACYRQLVVRIPVLKVLPGKGTKRQAFQNKSVSGGKGTTPFLWVNSLVMGVTHMKI